MAARMTVVAARGWRLGMEEGAVRVTRDPVGDGPDAHVVVDARASGARLPAEIYATIVRGGPRHIHLEFLDRAQDFADLASVALSLRLGPPGAPPSAARVKAAEFVALDDLRAVFLGLPEHAELIVGLSGDSDD
ncbi:MAG: hypothetical protein H0X27_14265 [Caulobacteraceae bacterium]|nr:hypothetical protein [Caulobacteraceae bacterium]